jgi:hypothetical protein
VDLAPAPSTEVFLQRSSHPGIVAVSLARNGAKREATRDESANGAGALSWFSYSS